MKTLDELKAKLPHFAKDVKTNLEELLGEKNKALLPSRIFGAALTSAYALKDKTLIKVIENEAKNFMSEAEINSAKMAVSIMAMNNSYYCFTHIAEDKEYLEMPSGLAMQSVKNPKIDQIDFEIFSFAASIINSCSMCIDSHESKLFNGGVTREQIQMIAKIAAVMSAVAQVLAIQQEE